MAEVTLTCAQCEKPFTTRRSPAQWPLHCSKKCMGVGLRRSVQKRCPTCRRAFIAGKSERHKKANVYCSLRCANLDAPVRCKTLTEATAGYLAGLLDGEGSIIAMKRADGTTKSYRMHIANTHKGVLDWCQRVTGLGTIHVQTSPKFSLDPKRPDAHHRYKVCYSWAVYGVKAASILTQILPYLHIKRDRAVAALEVVKP